MPRAARGRGVYARCVLARRLLIALAVLMGLTALAAGVAPRRPVPGGFGAEAPPVASAGQPPRPLERVLDADAAGQRVRARVGQPVVIEVRTDVLDTVSLAEYGNQPAEPDSPARFELLADTPGRYAIDLLEAGRRIGVLEVRP